MHSALCTLNLTLGHISFGWEDACGKCCASSARKAAFVARQTVARRGLLGVARGVKSKGGFLAVGGQLGAFCGFLRGIYYAPWIRNWGTLVWFAVGMLCTMLELESLSPQLGGPHLSVGVHNPNSRGHREARSCPHCKPHTTKPFASTPWVPSIGLGAVRQRHAGVLST